jgi:hypothetical protein
MPSENALDRKPTDSDSKEVTDQTGSITHDEVEERAYDEAIDITNEVHTDIEDLLVQRPRWNNPKSKETPQRLTVPTDSIIVDGTVSPFTNNEHIDKSLQGPVDGCAQQAGRDNQPALETSPAASSLEAVTLDLGEHTVDEPLPCFYSADD